MNINILLLGSLLILVLFDNFKKALERMNLRKIIAALLIVLELVLLFTPSLKLGDVTITMYGAVFPLVFSLWCMASIRRKQDIKSFGISFLISLLVYLIFSGIDYDIYYLMTIKPYVWLSVLLGLVVGFICKKEKIIFSSVFFGFILGNFIQIELNHNAFVENYVLGSNALLSCLLVSFVAGALFASFISFIKVRRRRKELSKGLAENID